MQAIILAAGKGTRLRPLTYHIPKPMIRVRGKNFLERSISILPDSINEVILVVGYKKEQIENHFSDSWGGKKIKYVVQKNLLGTGHAVKECESLIKGKFLVLMGDDIYSEDDISRMIQHDNAMLVQEKNGKFSGGRIKLNDQGNLEDIAEGTHERKKSFVNTAMYVLTPDIFRYEPVKLTGKKEFGLPQTIVVMAKDIQVKIEKANSWRQISDNNDLQKFIKEI